MIYNSGPSGEGLILLIVAGVALQFSIAVAGFVIGYQTAKSKFKK